MHCKVVLVASLLIGRFVVGKPLFIQAANLFTTLFCPKVRILGSVFKNKEVAKLRPYPFFEHIRGWSKLPCSVLWIGSLEIISIFYKVCLKLLPPCTCPDDCLTNRFIESGVFRVFIRIKMVDDMFNLVRVNFKKRLCFSIGK